MKIILSIKYVSMHKIIFFNLLDEYLLGFLTWLESLLVAASSEMELQEEVKSGGL